MQFALNQNLDTAAIRARFEADGYVQVTEVLRPRDAVRLLETLQKRTRWNLVFNDGGKHVDLSREYLATLTAEHRLRLQQAIYAQARKGFQYYYNNYPIYDAVRAAPDDDHPLHQFYGWLNSDTFLQWSRSVTGLNDISFADAQATQYGPGHFLTTHDDSAEGKCRRAAYVFNFTPDWPADWGGYLQLLDQRDNVRVGLRPVFNALNILAVPQRHNVSLVAPFAGAARTAITGWLRYGDPP